MSAVATSANRPYVSRRKRRRFSEEAPLLSNRSMLGFLGLLILGLLVSLAIIAAQLDNSDTVSASDTANSRQLPANSLVSR